MPRLIPTRDKQANGAAGPVDPSVTPMPVRTSLLVVQAFRDTATGVDYRPGDGVLLRHRSIRSAALARPDWFAVEFATAPLDVAWLADLHERAEQNYQAANREREKREARVLPDELEEQNRVQRESDRLERRYQKQQDQREKENQERLEERWRRSREEALGADGLEPGFHFE